MKKFNSEFGNAIVNQIKPVDLKNLQAKRKGEGLADATFDHEIITARGVINKAFDNGLVSGYPQGFQEDQEAVKASGQCHIGWPEEMENALNFCEFPFPSGETKNISR